MSQHPHGFRPPAEQAALSDTFTGPLSARAVEEFWADGTEVYSTPPTEVAADVAVDVPAVGRVPAVNLPGTAYVAGVVPQPLRGLIDNDVRDALLIRLIFAARRLAWAQDRFEPWGRFCRSCGATVSHFSSSLPHAPHCLAAETTRVVDELQSLVALSGGAR